jgi:hypothetical protein
LLTDCSSLHRRRRDRLCPSSLPSSSSPFSANTSSHTLLCFPSSFLLFLPLSNGERRRRRRGRRRREKEKGREKGERRRREGMLFFVHLRKMFYTCPSPKPDCQATRRTRSASEGRQTEREIEREKERKRERERERERAEDASHLPLRLFILAFFFLLSLSSLLRLSPFWNRQGREIQKEKKKREEGGGTRREREREERERGEEEGKRCFLYTCKRCSTLTLLQSQNPRRHEGKGWEEGKAKNKGTTGRRSMNRKTLFFVHPRGMFYTCPF